MADNYTTRIAKLLIRHDIDLAKLDAGNARKIRELFRSLGKDVSAHVLAIEPTETVNVRMRNRRLKQLVTVGAETIEDGFETIQDVTEADAVDLAKLEAATVSNAVSTAVGVDLVSKRVNLNVLKRLADDTLIQGAPSSEWWAGQSQELRNAFRREMREGVLLNEPIQELVRRIRGRRENGFKDGLIAYDSTASRRAQALARTSVIATANAARFETYAQNQEVIKGVQWLSTLDTKTSDICIALDGQAWNFKGHRLPGTTAKWRGPPPAHWNCRSSITPVMKSWAELATDPEVKRKLTRGENEGKLATGWRAAMDGKVSSDLNYGDWLKEQGKATQIEVLGRGKWKLWKEGKLNTRDLIDQSQEPFSLKDLTDKLARENT